ncbi:hypothetical protein [Fervidicola ferrireducens]|nr:hypothetical protein [Fervidicola ferrireducens]
MNIIHHSFDEIEPYMIQSFYNEKVEKGRADGGGKKISHLHV